MIIAREGARHYFLMVRSFKKKKKKLLELIIEFTKFVNTLSHYTNGKSL